MSYLVQSCSMRSVYAASVYGWISCPQRRMNSQRNVYANPLKCAYVVTHHLRLRSGTFSTPDKG